MYNLTRSAETLSPGFFGGPKKLRTADIVTTSLERAMSIAREHELQPVVLDGDVDCPFALAVPFGSLQLVLQCPEPCLVLVSQHVRDGFCKHIFNNTKHQTLTIRNVKEGYHG
jgi:hypothetical protein